MKSVGCVTPEGIALTGISLTTYHKFVAAASFTATQIVFFMNAEGGSLACTFGIYADNAGVPGTKLADTSEITVTTTASRNVAPLDSSVSIVNGTTYWICQAHASGSVDLYADIGSFTTVYSTDTYVSGATPASNPSTSSYATNRKVSCYAADTSASFQNKQTIFEGDSLTFGFDASIGGGTCSGGPYPKTTLDILGDDWLGVNVGVSGSTFVDLNSRAAALDARFDPTMIRNVLVVWCGTNDISLSGRTATQIYNDTVSYCQARQAAGWEVYICTLLPCDPGSTFNPVRNALNTLLVANYHTFATGIPRLDSDPNIGQDGDELDTTYRNADHVHENDTGYALTGTIVGNTIPLESIAITSPAALERGASGQALHVTITGGSSTSTADWTIAVGATAGSFTAIPTTGSSVVLTTTAPTATGTATLTHVPSGTTTTIPITDTVAPSAPSVTLGTVASYNFTLSWPAVTASPTGETITYDVKKNGSTVSSSQAGTTYAVASAVDGDVFAVDARDGSGNVSSLASKTFSKPSSGSGHLRIGSGISL